MLVSVEHAALPRFIYGNLDERPFMVMSLAPGRPAIEFCLAGSTLRPAEVLAVGLQVARALVELHAIGVLHRDVNAANVLVDRGAETRATLIDFGMAELTPRFYEVVDPRYLTPPERRVALGTGGLESLEWTAPEARAGEGWSGKCDVFSLGIVMFRALTGKMPFERGAPEGSAARPVLEVAPRCPRGLALAIDAALAVDPAMRPDAAGLVEELEVVAAELAAVEGAASGVASATERELAGAASRAGSTTGAGVTRARAVERRERWRWRAIYAVGVFGILYVGFLFGVAVKLGAPKTDVETTASAPASAASVPAVPSVRAVEHEGAASAVLAESPLAAVDAVVPALRGCAALAGERMTVEISIEAGNTTVARFEAVGHDADEVEACVRAVVGGLRFAAPTKAETIIKEVQA